MKNKIIYIIAWLTIVIGAYFIGRIDKTPVSELNRQIDQQEQLVSAHCGICNASKVNLDSLYNKKRMSMSGFTEDWLSQ